MVHRIARLFEPLLRLLLPGMGRHRLAATTTATDRTGPPPLPPYAAEPTAHHPGPRPLRGEDHSLVRPYLVAHERRQEAQRQRARRRALWLAVHGIDVGPHLIHGVEVTA
jgi:hypothetical protein